MTTSKRLLLPMMAFTMSACGPTAPKLVAPAQKLTAVSVNGGKLQYETQAKVDILLVVDNSLSMKPHQESLSKEINNFVDQFVKNGIIDFHIGVVPVYDTKAVVERKRTIHPAGHLIPLKNSAPGTFYGTPTTPNLSKALRETIKIGITPGPEWEESFSPVLAMMTPEVNQINQGFYRPEAHLAVIFITDADDAGKLSAEQFFNLLKEAKGGDASKILLTGAIPLEPTCSRDDDLLAPDEKGKKTIPMAPERMIRISSYGETISLCDKNLGTRLADFGNKLTDRVGRKVIYLPDDPANGTLKVTYGSQKIEENRESGYTFFPRQRKIELSGKLNVKHEENALIQIEYTAVNQALLRGGNVEVVGVRPAGL